jgi:hypothetical protein
MLRNRPPGSVRERGHAEICQLAPFELRRPFDQSLGRFIDAKPKPLFPKPSVYLCWRCHGHLQPYMYVDWTNFSRCALIPALPCSVSGQESDFPGAHDLAFQIGGDRNR